MIQWFFRHVSETPVVERSASPGVSHGRRTYTPGDLSDNRGVSETCQKKNLILAVEYSDHREIYLMLDRLIFVKLKNQYTFQDPHVSRSL